MKLFRSNDITAQLPPCAATIGFFDGLHRGHQFLIDKVRQVAGEHGLLSA
ncbi:MAG TPA: riboflavin biosynthesis protein RibF, partial [Candidatus Avibacteroides faecavium]|nr:riboflavin biosynthesis protein RibF [Candidatus Avibacteroides faecavium]